MTSITLAAHGGLEEHVVFREAINILWIATQGFSNFVEAT